MLIFNAAYSEALQFAIGAAAAFGLSVSLNKRGIGLSDPQTRVKAICYLSIFCLAWVVGMTVLNGIAGR